MATPVVRTESSKRRLRRLREEQRDAALRDIPLLADLPVNEIRWIGRHAVLRLFADRATIVTERMSNDFLYVVLQGTVTGDLHDRLGREVSLGILPVGSMFGEGSLFGDRFAGANVIAQSACQILQLSLEHIRTNRHQIPMLFERLKQTYRQRLLDYTLMRIPILAPLDADERQQFVQHLIVREVPRGETVVRAGDRPNGLHLIENGQFVIENQGKAVGHLDEGDFFGAHALIQRSLATDNVRAVTPCLILTLPSMTFYELLERHPEIQQLIQQVLDDRRAYNQQNKSVLDALVTHGVRRGDKLLLRDATKCPPGCDLCVRGCATRHGAPRLRLDGVHTDATVIADSCRQCRIGAQCVEACTHNAITWHKQALVVDSARCTGCGDCVSACDYDAMTLQPRDKSLFGRLIRTMASHPLRPQQPLIPLTPKQPLYYADKCDFCANHDNHACVSACPIGALRVVNVVDIFPY
jgi:CRP-like cAMP-binding protein/NAD-dependent dihydropyrimidine dehydrogenase PreA subunit